jgi:hypothetical protein
MSLSLCISISRLLCVARFGTAAPLSTAYQALGKPLVGCQTWDSDELSRDFDVGQAAREEIVNCAQADPQALGKLFFVFVVAHWRLDRAGRSGRCIVVTHNSSLFALPR